MDDKDGSGGTNPSPYDGFIAKGLFNRKEKQEEAGDSDGDGGDGSPGPDTAFGGGEKTKSFGQRLKDTFGGREDDDTEGEGEDRYSADDVEDEGETEGRGSGVNPFGETNDSEGYRPDAREGGAHQKVRMEEIDRMGDENRISQEQDGAVGTYGDRTDPGTAEEVAERNAAENERRAEDERRQREVGNQKSWSEEQDEAEQKPDKQNNRGDSDGRTSDGQANQIYRDPKTQEIFDAHARKFLKAAGEVAVENWGEGVSRGWDMAQDLVKMTLTHPSAMSSTSRAIGMAMTGLQTASDFADKAYRRYGIEANADPRLMENTLRYKLCMRDKQQGGQIVGNTFRAIATSLARNGGNMSDMSPSELASHMRDMQGEKDRLLAALQEPDLKPSDRRLLTAQAQHLQSYMTSISKQARSLNAQEGEARRYARHEDLARRRNAYDSLPTGEANPFSTILHRASPNFNLELDETGMPGTVSGLNAAIKTSDVLLNEAAADATLSDADRTARIEMYKMLRNRLDRRLQDVRAKGNAARTSQFGGIWQDFAVQNPYYANNMGEAIRQIVENGVFPRTISTQTLNEYFSKLMKSPDQGTRNMATMYWTMLNKFKNIDQLSRALPKLTPNDIIKARNQRKAEIDRLDRIRKSIEDSTILDDATKLTYLSYLDDRIGVEKSMLDSLENDPRAAQKNNLQAQTLYKNLHEALTRSMRNGGDPEGRDFNYDDPDVQAALKAFDDAVMRYNHKYFNKPMDDDNLKQIIQTVDGGDGNDADVPPGDDEGGDRDEDEQIPPDEDEGEEQDEQNVPPNPPPGGDEDKGGRKKTKQQQRKEARKNNVYNAVYGDDAADMTDTDRAILDFMVDNGLFKFNGDDTLKDPQSLSDATRKKLIDKVNGILDHVDLSDRAREILEDYRDQLADAGGEEYDDGKDIDPDVFFSMKNERTRDDILKELTDLGVLSDGAITLKTNVLKDVAKRMNMSASDLKKEVNRILNPKGKGDNFGGGQNNTPPVDPEEQARLQRQKEFDDIFKKLPDQEGMKAWDDDTMLSFLKNVLGLKGTYADENGNNVYRYEEELLSPLREAVAGKKSDEIMAAVAPIINKLVDRRNGEVNMTEPQAQLIRISLLNMANRIWNQVKGEKDAGSPGGDAGNPGGEKDAGAPPGGEKGAGNPGGERGGRKIIPPEHTRQYWKNAMDALYQNKLKPREFFEKYHALPDEIKKKLSIMENNYNFMFHRDLWGDYKEWQKDPENYIWEQKETQTPPPRDEDRGKDKDAGNIKDEEVRAGFRNFIGNNLNDPELIMEKLYKLEQTDTSPETVEWVKNHFFSEYQKVKPGSDPSKMYERYAEKQMGKTANKLHREFDDIMQSYVDDDSDIDRFFSVYNRIEKEPDSDDKETMLSQLREMWEESGRDSDRFEEMYEQYKAFKQVHPDEQFFPPDADDDPKFEMKSDPISGTKEFLEDWAKERENKGPKFKPLDLVGDNFKGIVDELGELGAQNINMLPRDVKAGVYNLLKDLQSAYNNIGDELRKNREYLTDETANGFRTNMFELASAYNNLLNSLEGSDIAARFDPLSIRDPRWNDGQTKDKGQNTREELKRQEQDRIYNMDFNSEMDRLMKFTIKSRFDGMNSMMSALEKSDSSSKDALAAAQFIRNSCYTERGTINSWVQRHLPQSTKNRIDAIMDRYDLQRVFFQKPAEQASDELKKGVSPEDAHRSEDAYDSTRRLK